MPWARYPGQWQAVATVDIDRLVDAAWQRGELHARGSDRHETSPERVLDDLHILILTLNNEQPIVQNTLRSRKTLLQSFG